MAFPMLGTNLALQERMRRARGWARYRYEVWAGRRNPMVPPAEVLFDGSQTADGFVQEGNALLGQLIEFVDLRPDSDVLDVGSGLGRLAVALTNYLRPEARYEGFDVVKWATDWCGDKITSRFPNFRFQHVEIRNSAYSPGRGVRAEQFRFPYDDASFDIAVLISVFTHLLPIEVERYLSEISRVLRPGGRTAISYFILNEVSAGNIRNGNAHFQFAFGGSPARWETFETPESALAYEEAYLLDLYARSGLEVVQPIRYGTWSQFPDVRDRHQDFVIASKAPAVSRRESEIRLVTRDVSAEAVSDARSDGSIAGKL